MVVLDAVNPTSMAMHGARIAVQRNVQLTLPKCVFPAQLAEVQSSSDSMCQMCERRLYNGKGKYDLSA